MDKLAERLKKDAACIEAQVSDELDNRIAASLRAVTPLKAPSDPPESARQSRAPGFWLASSLTGLAAALLVIAVINLRTPAQEPLPTVANTSPIREPITPTIEWNTEAAMLTGPLQQELEDLQSDIRKAEEKVKRDIGL